MVAATVVHPKTWPVAVTYGRAHVYYPVLSGNIFSISTKMSPPFGGLPVPGSYAPQFCEPPALKIPNSKIKK